MSVTFNAAATGGSAAVSARSMRANSCSRTDQQRQAPAMTVFWAGVSADVFVEGGYFTAPATGSNSSHLLLAGTGAIASPQRGQQT
jgi:hypothetical protein